MKRNTSLTTKFTVILLVILFIGQGLGFILFILSLRSGLLDSLNEKIERTGKILAGISAGKILAGESADLNMYLEEIMADEDLVSVRVFDKHRNILVDKTKTTHQKSSGINPFYVKTVLSAETPVIFKSENAGYVHIIYSSRRINDEIFKHMFFGIIYQGVLLIVVIFSISGFFNRHIRKPLSDFAGAVSKVSKGDLTVAVQPGGNLEIAGLKEEFGSLTSRLRKIIKKLHFTANNVTSTIKQLYLTVDKIIEGTNNKAAAAETVVSAMENAEGLQKKILDQTHDLAGFSQENSSSFAELEYSIKEINERAKELSHYSSGAYSEIAEILTGAKAITKSTEEFLKSTEEMSTSIEEVSTSIKEVENSTKESANLAALVREVAADAGMLTVADAMGGMDEIMDSVDKTLKLVIELNAKSRDVEKILTVMGDVTKQTNLLSVNTAILAAQAGEYGAGFSVVANEIKTLADRTSSSAKEITEIIKAIQKGISELTHVARNNRVIVEKGNTLIAKTGGVLNDVIVNAQKSSAMATTIRKSIEEQVKGVLQINEAMSVLVKIAEHVTEIARKQENKSVALLDVAEKFKNISEVIKNNMQEQNAGIHMLSKNFDFTNEMFKDINSNASAQYKTNKDILTIANQIKIICDNTLAAAREMADSFNALNKETETFRKDMEGFKIE